LAILFSLFAILFSLILISLLRKSSSPTKYICIHVVKSYVFFVLDLHASQTKRPETQQTLNFIVFIIYHLFTSFFFPPSSIELLSIDDELITLVPRGYEPNVTGCSFSSIFVHYKHQDCSHKVPNKTGNDGYPTEYHNGRPNYQRPRTSPRTAFSSRARRRPSSSSSISSHSMGWSH
jgi:hypothetical protein